MTRHKQSLTIYADTINHPDLNSLKRTLSRSTTKDNVIDWPLDFAIRAGFNPDKLIGKVVNHVAGVGHKIKDGFNYIVNYEAYLLKENQKARHQDKAAFREAAKQVAKHHEQPMMTKKYDAFKTQYPILAEYDGLLKQHAHLTGYYRERIDKKIQETTKEIAADNKLMNQIKRISPKLMNQIVKQEQQHFAKNLDFEY